MKFKLTWRLWFGTLIAGYLVTLALFCVMDLTMWGDPRLLKNALTAVVAPLAYAASSKKPNYPLRFGLRLRR